MGAAIAHEHASITKLSEDRQRLLKYAHVATWSSVVPGSVTLRILTRDIEEKILTEMQAKTSLELQLRKEFSQLLEDSYSKWVEEERKHEKNCEIELRHSWEAMELKWQELVSLFQGERVFQLNEDRLPHKLVPLPQAAPGPSESTVPAILLTSRNTYLPRQEGQIHVPTTTGGGTSKHGPSITNIWVWESIGHVNLLYDDFAASLHAVQETDGRSRHKGHPSTRSELSILPDRNASRGAHYYQHLMMMPALAAPDVSSTALTSLPITFLPMGERSLAIVHGMGKVFSARSLHAVHAYACCKLSQERTGTTASW